MKSESDSLEPQIGELGLRRYHTNKNDLRTPVHISSHSRQQSEMRGMITSATTMNILSRHHNFGCNYNNETPQAALANKFMKPFQGNLHLSLNPRQQQSLESVAIPSWNLSPQSTNRSPNLKSHILSQITNCSCQQIQNCACNHTLLTAQVSASPIIDSTIESNIDVKNKLLCMLTQKYPPKINNKNAGNSLEIGNSPNKRSPLKYQISHNSNSHCSPAYSIGCIPTNATGNQILKKKKHAAIQRSKNLLYYQDQARKEENMNISNLKTLQSTAANSTLTNINSIIKSPHYNEIPPSNIFFSKIPEQIINNNSAQTSIRQANRVNSPNVSCLSKKNILLKQQISKNNSDSCQHNNVPPILIQKEIPLVQKGNISATLSTTKSMKIISQPPKKNENSQYSYIFEKKLSAPAPRVEETFSKNETDENSKERIINLLSQKQSLNDYLSVEKKQNNNGANRPSGLSPPSQQKRNKSLSPSATKLSSKKFRKNIVVNSGIQASRISVSNLKPSNKQLKIPNEVSGSITETSSNKKINPTFRKNRPSELEEQEFTMFQSQPSSSKNNCNQVGQEQSLSPLKQQISGNQFNQFENKSNNNQYVQNAITYLSNSARPSILIEHQPNQIEEYNSFSSNANQSNSNSYFQQKKVVRIQEVKKEEQLQNKEKNLVQEEEEFLQKHYNEQLHQTVIRTSHVLDCFKIREQQWMNEKQILLEEINFLKNLLYTEKLEDDQLKSSKNKSLVNDD